MRSCPTCARLCEDAEPFCLRCRTPLRTEAPVSLDLQPSLPTTTEAPSLASRSLIVLVLVFVGALAARLTQNDPNPARQAAAWGQPARGPGTPRLPGIEPAAVPGAQPRNEREAFIAGFVQSCLRYGQLAWCQCLANGSIDRIPLSEIDEALEKVRNGRPDPRIGEVIVQCDSRRRAR